MDLGKLKENMVFKNYKRLCAFIGVQEKTGCSKKAQINEIERFVELEKKGHKIIVKRIYGVPKERIDARRKTIYRDKIESAILILLIKNKCISHTTSDLLLALGMINPNYKKYVYSQKALSALLNIDITMLRKFYKNTRDKLIIGLESALLNLSNKRVLSWSKKVILVLSDGKTRVATDKEYELIKSVESYMLKKYNYLNMYSVLMNNKYGDFMFLMSNAVEPEGLFIESYHSEYVLRLRKKSTNLELTKLEELASELNPTILKEYMEAAQRNTESADYIRFIEYTIKTNQISA